MFTLNGNPININSEYVAEDGTTYPHLRDSDIRQKLGIVESPDPEPYDQRFYWGTNHPKQLEDETVTPEGSETSYTQQGLKSQWKAHTKDTTNKLLAETDWMVIRKLERNIDVPQATADLRANIILKCAEIEAGINNSNTVDDLISVVLNQQWPTV